jgi:uncharacterized alpha-E superfamily protein
MISRVAEQCFWMSRYFERAESTARILEVNETLLLDFHVPLEQQWKPLLIISGIHDYPGPLDGESVQHHMTWDAANPSSIASSLAAARENARIIREVISTDMWERINYYYLWIQSPAAHSLYERNRSDFYNQIKRINQLILGISEGTMSHGETWEFYLLGKYLERSSQTARTLDVKYHVLLPTPEHVGTPVDHAHWTAILKSCSGYEPFLKRRLMGELGHSVAEFLIFDPLFPRSVRFCLNQCRKAVHAISGRATSQPGNEVEHALDSLLRWVNLIKIDDLVRAGLHQELTSVINRVHEIAVGVHRTYFDVRIEYEPSAAAKPPGAEASVAPTQTQTQAQTSRS